ncbi:MAG: metallophosphoesterase [Deltaproteobacteria bacterium]|jgi:predicted MPP superfamily phosphohydrolase|nr:metallophosphoesterase [Deltaproteobacteria bacterium]
MTIAILAILLFSTWYTPWRLKTALGQKSQILASVTQFMILAGYIAVIMTKYYITSPLGGVIYNVLGLLFIFQVYLTISVFILHLFSRPLARFNKLKLLTQLAIMVSLSLVIIGCAMAQLFTVTETVIQVKGLEKPVTIAHIPDLHLGSHRTRRYLDKVIKTIQDLKPDIVIYNGDLVDSDLALSERVFTKFKQIKAEQYYTTGNHEFYVNTDKALALAQKAGLKVLRSRMVETHGLQLIGLEYMNGDRDSSDAHRVNDLFLNEELPKIKRDPSKPTVLAHHSPVGVQYVAKEGIEVMLAGHTHGGQVFPGTVLIGLRFPYFKGRFLVDKTTLLVSQGAGTFGPILRLGSFNEIQLVKLVPSPDRPVKGL